MCSIVFKRYIEVNVPEMCPRIWVARRWVARGLFARSWISRPNVQLEDDIKYCSMQYLLLNKTTIRIVDNTEYNPI